MNTKTEFLTRLSSLLKEYNVTIEADVGSGSDTYGIYGRSIEVIHREKGSLNPICWLYNNGWELLSSDIDEQLGI